MSRIGCAQQPTTNMFVRREFDSVSEGFVNMSRNNNNNGYINSRDTGHYSNSRKPGFMMTKKQKKTDKPNKMNTDRYKTELCHSFSETGICKYDDKCQFAHGYKELRQIQRHPKYRTVLCSAFHNGGLCPYGCRCNFIHESEDSIQRMLLNIFKNM